MRGTIALIAACGLLVPEAAAQKAEDDKPKKPRKRTKRERADDYDPASAPVVVGKGGKQKRVVIRLDEINIEGRIPKPSVVYALNVRGPDAPLPADVEGEVAGAVDAVDAIDGYARARGLARRRTAEGRWPADAAWDAARAALLRDAAAILDAYVDEHGGGAPGAAAVAIHAHDAHAELAFDELDAGGGDWDALVAPSVERLERVVAATTGAERAAAAFVVMNAASGDAERRAALAVLCPANRTLSTPPVATDLEGCEATGLDAEQTAYAWYTLGESLDGDPDALAISAAAFERADLPGATRVAVTARIRQGATLLRLDRTLDAVAAFDRARRLGPDPADRELIEQYLALALSTADDGGTRPPDEALERARATLGDDAAALAAVLGRLAEMYADRADDAGAIVAGRAALDAAPTAREAPRWHADLIAAMRMGRRDPSEIEAERARFDAAYAEDGAWWAQHGRDPDAVAAMRASADRIGAQPSSDVVGSIEHGAVEAVLRRARGVLVQCARTRAIRGTLVLLVGDSGAVTSASTRDIDDEAARCITGIARRWTFPAPDAPAEVSIPLRLEPS
jgi:hypothetical protein